jgi:hypothetical protein
MENHIHAHSGQADKSQTKSVEPKGEYQDTQDDEYQGEDEGQDTDETKEYKPPTSTKETNSGIKTPSATTHSQNADVSLATSVHKKQYLEETKKENLKAPNSNSSGCYSEDEEEEEEDETSQPDDDAFNIVEKSP